MPIGRFDAAAKIAFSLLTEMSVIGFDGAPNTHPVPNDESLSLPTPG